VSPVFAHGQLRLYLLSLLDEAPRHGYEVIRALEERFGGLYSPSAGSIYPRLARLEEEGLVARTDEGRTAVYRITDDGRAEVRDRAGDIDDMQHDLDVSVADLAESVRSRVRSDTRDLRKELKEAAKQARRTARPEGVAASGGRSAVKDAEEALAAFRAQVRAELRRHGLPASAVAEFSAVLDDAAARLRDLAREP